jgi:MFS family permease
VIAKRVRAATAATGLAGFSSQLAPLARGQIVSSVGGGLWFTVWALYLTEQVGLSLSQAGLAMTVAGLIGFLAPIPLGRVADRYGPREIYRALLALEGLASLGFIVASGTWQVALVASAVAVGAQGGSGVSSALVVGLAPPEDRIEALARMRACSHAGQAAGAAIGAAVIAADTRWAFLAAIALNSASYLYFAATLGRVAAVAPQPIAAARPRLGAVRDVPFTTLAAICGVLCLCWGLMASGLPLWIADDTRAPHAISGLIVFASAVSIAAFQTVFSRGYDTPRSASRAAVRSAAGLALCCILLALAAGPGALPATALLLCAGAAHILGELWFVAASRGFSVPLMDARRPAEYQSVFAAGEALSIMLAPGLMTALVIPHRTAGWIGLALLFALAGLAAPPATRWATSHRPWRDAQGPAEQAHAEVSPAEESPAEFVQPT